MRLGLSAAVVLMLVVPCRESYAGGFADTVPPYEPVDIVLFIQSEEGRKALNTVQYQEAGIRTTLESFQKAHRQDADIVLAMKGPGSQAKIRALTARRSDELFRSLERVVSPEQLKRLKQILLQKWGMGLLEHPEIRESLKLSAEDAARLNRLYGGLRNDIVKQIHDRRITQQEAAELFRDLSNGVPVPVRAALTEKQQQVLDDLLGPPFQFVR
jgi:hypothetical protein